MHWLLTIHPAQGEARSARAAQDLGALLARHRPRAVAVGNGTAGRETLSFVRTLLAAMGPDARDIVPVLVNEAGASVYSASDLARAEHRTSTCRSAARSPSPAASRTRWRSW